MKIIKKRLPIHQSTKQKTFAPLRLSEIKITAKNFEA